MAAQTTQGKFRALRCAHRVFKLHVNWFRVMDEIKTSLKGWIRSRMTHVSHGRRTEKYQVIRLPLPVCET